MIYYSALTKGFYATSIHGDTIPADAVEITEDEHETLLYEQSIGKLITHDAKGHPVAIEPKATPDEMWRRIKEERDRRKNGGFLLGGKWYHSDPESLVRYLGLKHLGQNVPARQWKTMDGSRVPLTPQLAADIFAAAVAHDGACFDAAEDHKLAMEASVDPSAYDFSAGWPEVYLPI